MSALEAIRTLEGRNADRKCNGRLPIVCFTQMNTIQTGALTATQIGNFDVTTSRARQARNAMVRKEALGVISRT